MLLLTRRDPGPRIGHAQPRWKVPGFLATTLGRGWPQSKARTDPDTNPRRVPRPGRRGLKPQRAPAKPRGRRVPTRPREGCSGSSRLSRHLQSLSGAGQRRCGDKLPGSPSAARRLLRRPHRAPHTHTRHPGRARAACERRRAGLEVGVLPHSPPPKRRPHPPPRSSPSLSLLRK